jgi:heat shock protein HslJ
VSESPLAPPLGGTRWLLAELGDERVPPSEPGRAPYLVLEPEEARVYGSGGCNRLMGPIELEGDGLRFGPLATTLMHCGDEAMALERAFLDALEATRTYSLEGATLVLLGDGHVVLARLQAAI